MTNLRVGAAVAVACFMLSGAVALADDSSLILVLGGEAYDGAPEFTVTFNGTELGGGSVETAIDTETAGRIADVADKSPYVQSYEFPIRADIFTPDGELRVRFTNEAFGGEGSGRDRNLFLVSASINGRVILGPGFKTFSASGVEPNEMVGDLLALYQNNQEGVTTAPAGGWPSPEGLGVETVSLEPDAVASGEVLVDPTGGPLIIEPSPDRLTPEFEEAALSTLDAGSTGVAALASDVVASDEVCGLDEIYNVVGFNENSNDLTPRLTERLDQIIADIGEEKCTVQITGFSSTQGAYATNALFAIERAQNVLAYMRDAGLEFEKVNATGAGETSQFGDGFSTNRRVVITVRP